MMIITIVLIATVPAMVVLAICVDLDGAGGVDQRPTRTPSGGRVLAGLNPAAECSKSCGKAGPQCSTPDPDTSPTDAGRLAACTLTYVHRRHRP
jgi:hypothetical protein